MMRDELGSKMNRAFSRHGLSHQLATRRANNESFLSEVQCQLPNLLDPSLVRRLIMRVTAEFGVVKTNEATVVA